MKKTVTGFVIVILTVLVLWVVHPQMAYLPEATPEEMDLGWQECPLAEGYGSIHHEEELLCIPRSPGSF